MNGKVCEIPKYNSDKEEDIEYHKKAIKVISEISLEVGSPNYVKTPVFQKRENPLQQTTQPIVDKRKKGKKTMRKTHRKTRRTHKKTRRHH